MEFINWPPTGHLRCFLFLKHEQTFTLAMFRRGLWDKRANFKCSVTTWYSSLQGCKRDGHLSKLYTILRQESTPIWVICQLAFETKATFYTLIINQTATQISIICVQQWQVEVVSAKYLKCQRQLISNKLTLAICQAFQFNTVKSPCHCWAKNHLRRIMINKTILVSSTFSFFKFPEDKCPQLANELEVGWVLKVENTAPCSLGLFMYHFFL